jgi:hypothetical protein
MFETIYPTKNTALITVEDDRFLVVTSHESGITVSLCVVGDPFHWDTYKAVRYDSFQVATNPPKHDKDFRRRSQRGTRTIPIIVRARMRFKSFKLTGLNYWCQMLENKSLMPPGKSDTFYSAVANAYSNLQA